MLAPFRFLSLENARDRGNMSTYYLKLSAQSMQKKIKEDTSILDEK
jgi:hypothetical protein